MNDNSPSQKKDELIRAIEDSETAAGQAVVYGQRIVQQSHSFEQKAGIAKQATKNIPDDTYLARMEWDRQIAFWTGAADGFKSHSGSTLSIGLTGSTATVSTSSMVFEASYIRPLPPENKKRKEEIACRLTELVHVTSWDEELEGEFVRLGLHQTIPSTRSSLDHFRAAKKALSTPSAGAPDPSAVLIAARGCMDQALADLVQRCPKQQRTKNASAKVEFIYRQIGKPEVDSDQVTYLVEEVEKLHGNLSAAKQTDLSTTEVRTLFAGFEAFMKSFLLILDDQRMRIR